MTKKTAAILLLVGAAVALFTWAATRQGTLVNTDMHAVDQSAYTDYAKELARTNFDYVGRRNRMPVYPGLMALFHRDGMSDEAFFRRGKQVGIVLALAMSPLVFLVFRRVARPLDAGIATLVAMFAVFAYKAPYFQADILFYGVGLLLFYLLVTLIRRPEWRTAALAGVTAGVGHLIKASVLPTLLLATPLLIIRGMTRGQNDEAGPGSASLRQPRRVLHNAACALVLLGCFLVVVFPYIRTSKERFGRYFYNVNSTFYMWYDSWDEAERGTKAHGDRDGWPNMPADQIPSFRKYVAEHSLRSMAGRVVGGLRTLWHRVTASYEYAEFVAVYLIALLLLFGQNWRRSRLALSGFHPCVTLFVGGYFGGYTLLYAWYTPIGVGNRFELSLFLPSCW